MKKTIQMALIALALCSVSTARAQVKFGIKAGINVSQMSMSRNVVDASNRLGYFVGPTLKIGMPIIGIGCDISALYDHRDAKLKDSDVNMSKTISQESIKISINLRYGIGFGDNAGIFAFAGPQFGFNIGDKKQTLVKDAADWRLETSNFSINIGAGAILAKHLQVAAGYNIVCGKTGEVRIDTGIKEKVRGRNNAWQLSGTYYF